MSSGLGDRWHLLNSEGQKLGQSELVYFRLDRSPDATEILLANDIDGRRHLLIAVPADMQIVEDRRSKGIRISARDLEEDGEVRKFIDVVCRVPELNDLFDSVATDMIGAIDDDPTAPSAACREVLNRWRELIEREPGPKLGQNELIGLFGELLVLNEITALSPESLDFWFGPERERHDFENTRIALEVKTSTILNGRVCTVHGHLQLVPPQGASLYLFYLRVERSPNGISVPELIDLISKRQIDQLKFRELLSRAKYDERHAEEYAKFSLAVLERRLYRVDENFPKIVPESFSGGVFPGGVQNLEYVINLINEPPVPVTEADEMKILRQLAGTSL